MSPYREPGKVVPIRKVTNWEKVKCVLGLHTWRTAIELVHFCYVCGRKRKPYLIGGPK